MPTDQNITLAPALPYSATFFPLGFPVEVLTNDDAVLDLAADTWGRIPPRQDIPTLRITFSISGDADIMPPAPRPFAQEHLLSLVADTHNHAFCDLNAGFAYATLSRAALRSPLYFRYHFLESMALSLISSLRAPALHAASVTRHSQGLLLCGASGAGKSSLAYACARAGFTFTSDDSSYLLVDSPSPCVTGNSHKFRFRPHSRDLFPELSARELTPRLEGKPSIEVPTSELPGISTSPDAPVHHLIVLKRAAKGRAHLKPVPIDDALQTLRDNLYPVGSIRERQLLTLDQLNPLPAHEFHYSDLNDAVRVLSAFTAEFPRA